MASYMSYFPLALMAIFGVLISSSLLTYGRTSSTEERSRVKREIKFLFVGATGLLFVILVLFKS